MNRRRATSTCSLSGTIQRNMRYINHLRRRIRDLEEEAAELSQRLNMLLADVDVNIAENNGLSVFQQEVQQQVQLQDALNVSLQEEIRHLTVMIGQDDQEQARRQLEPEPEPEPVSNTGRGSEPSTSGISRVAENANPAEQRGAEGN